MGYFLNFFQNQPSPFPSIPWFYSDLNLFFEAFLFFAIGDLFLKTLFEWMRKNKNGRYFTLHVLCNAYVTITTIDDVWITYQDPVGSILNPCDSKAIAVILALHLVHIIFYQPLDIVDWYEKIWFYLFHSELCEKF